MLLTFIAEALYHMQGKVGACDEENYLKKHFKHLTLTFKKEYAQLYTAYAQRTMFLI